MKVGRVLSVAVVLSVAAAACRGRPTREWRADDHDEEPGSAQPAGSGSTQAVQGDDAVADAAWRVSCAECHGLSGRGDGPKSPMTQPPNLTDKAYVAGRTDEQLAATIRGGRGKMPAFPALPPNVVAGLVRRVRTLAGP